MIEVFRIMKEKHANTTVDGEGARLYPGRWNSYGVPVVYTAASLALATLELIVQLEALPAFKYVYITATIPDPSFIYEPPKLIPEWNQYPYPHTTQALGSHWVTQNTFPVLKIPSVIIPSEFNFILNPKHPDFNKIILGKPTPFGFDKDV